MSRLPWLLGSSAFLIFAAAIASCSSSSDGPTYSGGGTDGGTAGDSAGGGGTGGSSVLDAKSDGCKPFKCSEDHKMVLDCNGALVHNCEFSEQCAGEVCLPACEASQVLRTSVGCDYYPVVMGAANWTQASYGCFAVFLANTWSLPVNIQVEYKNATLDLSKFAYTPEGTGANIEYKPLDTSAGLAPGKVAILFLYGPPNPNPGKVSADCPIGVTAATTDTGVQIDGSGIGNAFHVTTDYPVVAYQMLPFGGGSAAVTGASLLLPTSVWDVNYVAVNAYAKSSGNTSASNPSLNLVAMEDDTQITMVPKAAVVGGNKIPAADANSVMTITLNKGQFAQITQPDELTGSPIESTKPIGLMAGHECMFNPTSIKYCDHAEQQIPPVKSLGSEYVAVPYRPRFGGPENMPWRIIGGLDGTKLEFEPASVHAAQTVNRGEILELTASEPFVVKSQGADFPFILAGYMTGSQQVKDGYGDPDFVRMVPPQQYLQRYVFFTDPTYPETNLVMVRGQGAKGFADVNLDCAGVVPDWQPIGSSGLYEYARFDLVRHNFEPQGKCDNGRHEITSEVPFGLWVWGWGTTETGSSPMTENVSYGYPAGENVVQLNNIKIPSIPK